MLFKKDALIFLRQRYINDLEFYEDIKDEIVYEYNKMIPEIELELNAKFKSLLEWKKNKDIYKAEQLRKELKDIENSDFLMSLQKYLVNKN